MTSKKPQYSKPASQVDLEERQATGNRSLNILSTSPEYPKSEEDKGKESYIGTSSEYQNDANFEEVGFDPDSPEGKVADAFVNLPEAPSPEDWEEAEPEAEADPAFEAEVKEENGAPGDDKNDSAQDESNTGAGKVQAPIGKTS